MTRIVYLNGEYLPADEAKVSIFDRGLLFGDAIYEVAGVLDGKLIDFSGHMRRLWRSLGELSLPQTLSEDEILAAYRHLVEANNIREGLVYMQITRGEAERAFEWIGETTPTILMFAQEKLSLDNKKAKTGVKLKSVEDIRWARRDIKTVNLLGQVLAKQAATEAGAYEALMIDTDGFVTECSATSFFFIKNNTIVTRPLSNDILPGVTRRSLISLSKEYELAMDERLFTLDEVYEADEAFITGASTYVLPVVMVDDRSIGTGQCGPLATRLREIYVAYIRETAI
ncbi:MAG: D-amino-acid transaminase [Chloroflexota bacterium]